MKSRGVYTAGLLVTLIVIMVAPPAAQTPQVSARASGAIGAAEPSEHVDILVGRSAVLRTERPITRISLPTPDIADALVTSPNEVLIHGKAPGTISLLIWDDTRRIRTYDVSVRRDLGELQDRVRQLFPGEPIAVTTNGTDVVLSGIVSSKYVVDKATSLAGGYVAKPENVVNLLRQEEGVASNQVLLRVRFAEVSRSALQELGASFFTGPNGYKDWVGRTSPGTPGPDFDDGKLVFSDFLNLFAFNTKENLGTVIKALTTRGLFQSLAEPNLVTQNGREASFLAGGEYPYPVVQGSGLNAAVTIMFKEFGVRLRFTPTLIGNDLVQLKVAPEVSALDFANAVTIEGFRVPALSTRRTETEVELRDGQTFAIAGLIDNSVTETMSKIPGIGDIPVLGYLFRSRAYQKRATELVVMITPHILRRDSIGVTPDLPGLVQPFLPDPSRRLAPPPPAFTPPRAAVTGTAADDGSTRINAPAADAAPSPDAAPTQDAAPSQDIAPSQNMAPRQDGAPQQDAAPPQDEAVPPQSTPDATVPTRANEAAALEQAHREQQQRQKDAEAEARRQEEQRRKDEEQARKQAEAEARKQAEEARKQAEVERKAEEARAREAERLDAERQEQERRAAEQARRDAERAEKEAAEARKIAEREAREEAKREQERLDAERKDAERARKEEEKLAKERAKREAEEAARAAALEQARLEQDRKEAEARQKLEEKLAKERAKREAELERKALWGRERPPSR